MGNLPNETSGQNRYVTLFRQPRRVQIHRSKRGREASALTGWRVSFTQSESAGASPPRPWPADRVERWPIGRLIPYANNPRLHTEADRDKIAASILKWGWTPVLADEDGVLLVGHARVDSGGKAEADIDPGNRRKRLDRGRETRLSLSGQSTGGAGGLGPRSIKQ